MHDRTVRFTHGYRIRAWGAHHHALDHGLAADDQIALHSKSKRKHLFHNLKPIILKKS
jgi:hypothetical protein